MPSVNLPRAERARVAGPTCLEVVTAIGTYEQRYKHYYPSACIVLWGCRMIVAQHSFTLRRHRE